MYTEFLHNLKDRSHLKHTGINCKIILKWLSNEYNKKTWIRFIWLGVETNVMILGCGNESSVTIKHP